MEQTTTGFSFSASLRVACVLFLGAFTSLPAALDWGGGLTRFAGKDGTPLTSQSGFAVLVAVSEGSLIDFSQFTPQHPQDLVSPGAILRDGASINRVVANSSFFYSGYLLYSAIPNVSAKRLAELNIEEGSLLYLVVWDRSTFSDGLPTDGSYYTAQALFQEGAPSKRAQSSLEPDTIFAQVAYPNSSLAEDRTRAVARRAGHNTFSNYTDWLRTRSATGTLPETDDLRSVDIDQDGRQDFEQYALRTRPRLGFEDAEVPSTQSVAVAASLAGATEERSNPSVPSFVAELRASDPSIAYTVHASTELSEEWLSVELRFQEGIWVSPQPALAITQAVYEGEGIWTVAMQYLESSVADRCFYKISIQ